MEQPGSEKILEADMIFLALGFLGGPVFGGWALWAWWHLKLTVSLHLKMGFPLEKKIPIGNHHF